MHTYRFGRKLKLPATIAIKHQISKLMFEDSVKKAAAGARAEANSRTTVRKATTARAAEMRSTNDARRRRTGIAE